MQMGGRKFTVLENNKKNFTKEELKEREALENMASEGFDPLQKTAPKHLDYVAKYEYERVWEGLQTLPVKNLDRTTLELYCTWYSIYRKAEQDIKENGIFMIGQYIQKTKDEDGKITSELVDFVDKSKKNPSISIMNDASSNIMRCASNLGLTVDSRMRIYTPPKEEKKKSIFDKFG